MENANISKNTNVSPDVNRLNIYIICECGTKINLSFDAREMGKAIELHAKEHARKKTDDSSSNAEVSRIENLLTEQVFNAIKSIKKP